MVVDDDDDIIVPREWLDGLLAEVVALQAALARLSPKIVAELERLALDRARERESWARQSMRGFAGFHRQVTLERDPRSLGNPSR